MPELLSEAIEAIEAIEAFSLAYGRTLQHWAELARDLEADVARQNATVHRIVGEDRKSSCHPHHDRESTITPNVRPNGFHLKCSEMQKLLPAFGGHLKLFAKCSIGNLH